MSKVIVVTGGSRGIGAAVARRLAANDYAIVVTYTSDLAQADAVVRAIEDWKGRAVAVQADVADPVAVRRLFEAADGLGQVVGLVNAAGLSGSNARIDEVPAEELTRLYAVNAIGPMLTSREAILRMSTRHGGEGGAIVNFSSVAARLGGLPGMVAYATTKAAVENFTRGLAGEVGPEGIRVNAVAPGMIETDMTRGPLENASFKEMIVNGTPLRRIGEADEVADTVAWLMSNAASFVTAQTITVSGGI